MRFLFVGSHVCLRLPSDGRSPFRPCHGLVLVLLCFWFSDRGLAPHKFTPVPGVHLRLDSVSALTRLAGQPGVLHSPIPPYTKQPLHFSPEALYNAIDAQRNGTYALS